MTEVAIMVQTAIRKSNIPPKAIAREINYSVDAVYAAAQGKRPIPQDVKSKQKLSRLDLLLGMAVALEDTGYHRIFRYYDGDRHIQSLIQRNIKEDTEADKAVNDAIFMLLDKQKAEDLAPEEVVKLKQVATEICDRICFDLNLLIEFDSKYRLGLLDYLQTKEKQTLKSWQAQRSV